MGVSVDMCHSLLGTVAIAMVYSRLLVLRSILDIC